MSAELPRLITKEDDRFGPFITALRAALDEIGCEGIAKTNSPTWGTRMEAILLRHILQFIPHVPVQCVSQPTAPTVIPSTASPVQGETLTPRTDAEERTSERYDGEEIPGFDYVSSDFSRTLERELAEAKEWVEYYKLNAASWRNSYDDRRAREEKAFADLQSAQSSLALAQARAGELEKERDGLSDNAHDAIVRPYREMLAKNEAAFKAALRSQAEQSGKGEVVSERPELTAEQREAMPEHTLAFFAWAEKHFGKKRIPLAAAAWQAAIEWSDSQPAPSAQPASEDWMEPFIELRESLSRHAVDCHDLREQYDDTDRAIARLNGKNAAYTHAAELLADATDRAIVILRRHQPAPQVGDGLDGKRLDWLLCTEGSLPAMEKAWLKIEPPTGNTPYGDPKIKGRAAIDAAMEGKR